MRNINTYIIEKFKISKDIGMKKDLYLDIPYDDLLFYFERSYKDKRINLINGWTYFVLNDIQIKEGIKKYKSSRNLVYEIPKEYLDYIDDIDKLKDIMNKDNVKPFGEGKIKLKEVDFYYIEDEKN